MRFHKDILVLDFEGFIDPTQIGVVLLDKETLEEKDSYVSYVHANLQGYVSKTTGITQDMLSNAPSQAEVGKELYKKFGTNFFIGTWVGDLDIRNFKKLITAAGIPWKEYDYHVYDIWPVAYTYLLKQGYTGSVRSEEMFVELGAQPRDKHDALEDARIAAEVLRKIVAK